MWAIKASNHAEVYFNVRVDRVYWSFTSQPSASLCGIFCCWIWRVKLLSSAHLVGRPQVPQADENGRPDLRGVQGKVWRLRHKAAERRGFEIWQSQRGQCHHERTAATVVDVWRALLCGVLDVAYLLQPVPRRGGRLQLRHSAPPGLWEGLLGGELDIRYVCIPSGAILKSQTTKLICVMRFLSSATRIQFLAIEIARNREGYNSGVFRAKQGAPSWGGWMTPPHPTPFCIYCKVLLCQWWQLSME